MNTLVVVPASIKYPVACLLRVKTFLLFTLLILAGEMPIWTTIYIISDLIQTISLMNRACITNGWEMLI